VDARTINDVTVSPDGRYGVLSREGASNRVNGVVILDLADPAHPKVAATFDQELTGGVHNMFATDDYLFAVSGGSKYVIIDVRDIYNPKYVSEYRHPNARLHDLWVHDGIAYSAQGGAGTVVVDVGNGKYGGTIENPKLITVFPINSGHEIFPYFQEKHRQGLPVHRRRVHEPHGPRVGGHELPRRDVHARRRAADVGRLHAHRGLHRSDEPAKVARYHLEDYGSHDIIVEDDMLYRRTTTAACGSWTCRACCWATWPTSAARSPCSSRSIRRASRRTRRS
jgi:hypothetical protein